MAKRGMHQKERDSNRGNGIRASHQGDVSKLPGKTIANYLKPTISSCHVGGCRYPRSQKQAPEASSMAASSAKPRSSINKARLLSSVPERNPASISSKERARTRADKSPMTAAISSKKRTTGAEKSPVTAAISFKERTRRSDGRSSMAAISPKPSLGKAFKTPTSGKAVPLRKANVAATTSTTAAKSEDDKVIHVDETQTQDQAKGTEVEVEQPQESKAKVESAEPKAAKTDDDEVSHEAEGKMELQPESEVGGDKTLAEEKEKGEDEGVKPKGPANGRNEPLPAYNAVIEDKATKLAARRNKVLALAGAFESVISLQMPEASSKEQAAMTVRSVSRGRIRAAQSTQPQTEEGNGGNDGATLPSQLGK
ncbi:hypothetical protein B296_00054706 [Ensete ventricosum]|uniref:Calmodulin-binding domain-containing protein n=1 Tax=Ensete ventricosum TaxID=4639 RepID=A0A426XGQ5_ENSVE|nr:hypothetical protein B296_00054706 [Ensete ventricosum]